MRESHAKGCTAPLLPPTNCWSPGPDCRLRLGFSSLTIYTRQAYIFSLELSEKNAKRIAPPGDRPPPPDYPGFQEEIRRIDLHNNTGV